MSPQRRPDVFAGTFGPLLGHGRQRVADWSVACLWSSRALQEDVARRHGRRRNGPRMEEDAAARPARGVFAGSVYGQEAAGGTTRGVRTRCDDCFAAKGLDQRGRRP